MKIFICCNMNKHDSTTDDATTKEQVKNKIETQYKKYVSGELSCTPKESEVIKNNYKSWRKIERLL